MDLVISIDAMAAHLAGALRVPVCLLLDRVANWRWIEGRNDSPWYPDMRVFWEHSGWENVITQVGQHLEQRGRLLRAILLRDFNSGRALPGAAGYRAARHPVRNQSSRFFVEARRSSIREGWSALKAILAIGFHSPCV